MVGGGVINSQMHQIQSAGRGTLKYHLQSVRYSENTPQVELWSRLGPAGLSCTYHAARLFYVFESQAERADL